MAEVRKSATHVAARERARQKAAEFRARHDQLEQLAADYFVVTDQLEQTAARAEEEVQAVHARAEQASIKARTDAEVVIKKMLAVGISRQEVAARLGIPTRAVKVRPESSPTDTAAQADPSASHPEGESSS